MCFLLNRWVFITEKKKLIQMHIITENWSLPGSHGEPFQKCLKMTCQNSVGFFPEIPITQERDKLLDRLFIRYGYKILGGWSETM